MTAPSIAYAGAYSNFNTNALHFTTNQAALPATKRFMASVYGEKAFLLQELSYYHVAVAQPVGNGAFGLQVAYAGNADYNALKTGLAYGQNLGKRISIGVQFDYWSQRIRGYAQAAQVTAEGGLLVHVSEVFQAGLQICNPAGVVFQKGLERMPVAYALGAGYQPSENVALTAALIKTEHVPWAVQAGAAYRFAPLLWAKAGINSRTAAFFVAAGYQLKYFTIEVVGSVHPQLGLSPALLLTYTAMDK